MWLSSPKAYISVLFKWSNTSQPGIGFDLKMKFIVKIQNKSPRCITLQIQIVVMVKWSEVAQSCLTLCNPVDCSLPGSSIHGTLQARILQWVAISFSRGSSRPRDRTPVSRTAGRRFTLWAMMVVPLNQAFNNWNKVLQVCQQLFTHRKSQ